MRRRVNRGFVRATLGFGVVALALSCASLPAEARKSKKPRPAPVAPAVVAHGPMTLIVSLREQRVHVYRGTTQVDAARVSTGMPGYRTPSGVFSILGKERWHRSNLYSNAPMPFMQRVTWSGVALHQGVVPGYPASHGCIRLPGGFAHKLFGMTKPGLHVLIVRGNAVGPAAFEHATLFQPTGPEPIATVAPAIRLAAAGTPALVGDDAGTSQGASEGSLPEDSAVVSTDQDVPDDVPPPAAAEADETAPPTDIAALPPAVKKSSSPLRIFVTQRTGRERMKDLQLALNALGYKAGEADGFAGKGTVSAIKAFQKDKGLPVTGASSEGLVKQVYDATGKGEPPAGHLYVRQDFTQVFDAIVEIKDGERPLGTHLFTAMDFKPEDSRTEWTAITPEAAPNTAAEALDRITISDPVRQRIASLLTPGSSFLISDGGISSETSPKGSDFVALTRPHALTQTASAQPASDAPDAGIAADEDRPVKRIRRYSAQQRALRRAARNQDYYGGRQYYGGRRQAQRERYRDYNNGGFFGSFW